MTDLLKPKNIAKTSEANVPDFSDFGVRDSSGDPIATQTPDFSDFGIKKAPPVSAGNPFMGALTETLDGALLGFADEIQSAIAATVAVSIGKAQGLDIEFGDAYKEAKNLFNQDKQALKDNIGDAGVLGLNVAGGIATGSLLSKAGLSLLGGPAASSIGRGAQIVGGGAATGAVAGIGFSEKEGLSKLEDAPGGALAGGATAGVLGLLSAGGKVLVNKLLNKAKTGQITSQRNVPLTKGQRTQDPDVQFLEERASKGVLGGKAQTLMRDARSVQQASIRNKLAQIGETAADLDDVSSIEKVTQHIQTKARVLKADIDAAFAKTRGGGKALVDRLQLKRTLGKEFVKTIRDNGFDARLSTMNDAKALLGRFRKIATIKAKDEIDVSSLEAWRTDLSRASREAFKAGRDSEGFLLTRLKEDYDEYMTLVLQKGLLNGDDEVLAAFKEGVSKRAEYARLFEKNTIIKQISSGRALNGDELFPETATNMIFGRGSVGKVSQSGAIIDDLIKASGDKADDVLADLKAGTVQRILNRSEGSVLDPNDGVTKLIQPGKLVSEIDNLLSNKSLVKKIFTEDEIGEFINLKDNLVKIASKQDGVVNTSGTTDVLFSMMNRFGFMAQTPFIGTALKEFRDAKTASQVARGLGEFGKHINDTYKPRVIGRQIIGGVTGGSAVAEINAPLEITIRRSDAQ